MLFIKYGMLTMMVDMRILWRCGKQHKNLIRKKIGIKLL